MASKSGFFQADFSAALLRGAAIAIALVVSVFPAHAETVTLVCQDEETNESFVLRVDYGQKIVDYLYSDGTTRASAPARIMANDIWWEVRHEGRNETAFKGGLDRLSGRGWVIEYDTPRLAAVNMGRRKSGPCRRATQKF
jgi:hypothetical protein